MSVNTFLTFNGTHETIIVQNSPPRIPANRSCEHKFPRAVLRVEILALSDASRMVGLVLGALPWVLARRLTAPPHFFIPRAASGLSTASALRLLAQDQHSVALFDADEALEKAFPKQVHLARLGRQNKRLDIVHIEAGEAEAVQKDGRRCRHAVGRLNRARATCQGDEAKPRGRRSGDEDVACAGVDKHAHRQTVDKGIGRILAALVSSEQGLAIAGRLALGRLRDGALAATPADASEPGAGTAGAGAGSRAMSENETSNAAATQSVVTKSTRPNIAPPPGAMAVATPAPRSIPPRREDRVHPTSEISEHFARSSPGQRAGTVSYDEATRFTHLDRRGAPLLPLREKVAGEARRMRGSRAARRLCEAALNSSLQRGSAAPQNQASRRGVRDCLPSRGQTRGGRARRAIANAVNQSSSTIFLTFRKSV